MEGSIKLYSLNVQGVPQDFTKQKVVDIFGEFGDIVDCYIAPPRPNRPHDERTWATVTYSSKMEAAIAISRLDRRPPLNLSVVGTVSQQGKDGWKKFGGRGDRGILSAISSRGGVGGNRGPSLDTQNSREFVSAQHVPAAMPEPCANCSQDGRLRCSRCKTWYCSVVCQENHWTRHRDSCYAPPPLENPDGSVYDPTHDSTIVKVIDAAKDDDSETNSDQEVMSLQRLSELRTMTGPLNSTLKDDNVTAMNDQTVLEASVQVDQQIVMQSQKRELSVTTELVKNKSEKSSGAARESEMEKGTEVVAKPKIPLVENEEKKLEEKTKIENVIQVNATEPTSDKNGTELRSIIAPTPTQISISNETVKNQEKNPADTPVGEILKEPVKIFNTTMEEKLKNVSKSSVLQFDTPTTVTVSHAVSPSEFYVIPDSSKDMFESILVEIQDQPAGVVEIKAGVVCLARNDGLWYRSRIEKVSPDKKKTKVVFIDFGNVEKIDVSEMKPLVVHKDVDGVAVRVRMAAVGPSQDIWSKAEIENFKEIIDAGGETKFNVTAIGFNDKRETLVNLVDDDKTDVGTLCVDVGVGIKIIDAIVKDKKEDLMATESKTTKFENIKDAECKKMKHNQVKIQAEDKEVNSNKPVQIENTKNKPENVDTKNKPKANDEENEPKEEAIQSDLKFSNPTEVTVVHVVSPRDMSFLPSSKAEQWNDLVVNTQDPAAAPGSVQPKVGEVYLANHDGLWARALIQKISPDRSQAKVDLIDFGNLGIKVQVGELRELVGFKEVEGLVARVGLAGLGVKGGNWGENELEMFKQVVDVGGESKFIVEGLGALDGVEMVTMKDLEGSDIKEMCVELDIGMKLEEFFTPIGKGKLGKEMGKVINQTKVDICKPNEKEAILENIKPPQNTPMKNPEQKIDVSKENKATEEVLEKKKTDQNVEFSSEKNSPQIRQQIKTPLSLPKNNEVEPRKFPRHRLPEDKPQEVSVTFAESPTKFYVSPVSKSADFNEVFLGCQDVPPGKVFPKIGLVCLVFFEECWHRAELEKVSPDGTKVKVFLLDYGKTIKAGVSDLKPLNKFLDIPGLVCEVGLDGIKPVGSQWSEEEIQNFNLVIDAGGETKFLVKALGMDENEVVRVEMVDLEENNITKLSLEMGVGVACKTDLKKIEIVTVTESTDNEKNENTAKEVINIVDSSKSIEKIQPELEAFQKSEIVGVIEKKVEKKHAKSFPRTIFPLNVTTDVNVSHADNPSQMFLFPTSANDKFMEVLEGCQDPPTGTVNPEVGLVCLAFADEAWYRAEIIKIFPDKVKTSTPLVQVFLLDYGKTIEVPAKELKPLNKFREVPGLVVEVGLVNLGCAQEGWSKDALDNLKIVLDVGGDTTFTVTHLGKDEDGLNRVKMVDAEGNDLTDFCVEMAIGVKVEHSLKAFPETPLTETIQQKEVLFKSTSPRTKPTTPIKAAAPLKAAVADINATNISAAPTKACPYPARLPPCGESILTTLVVGSKLQVMKDAESQLSKFTSICMTEDDENMNYLLDNLQSEAATFRLAGVASVSPQMRSWVVAWSSADQMYYRAVIIEVTPPDTYTALLIDFAMTQQFRKADLLDIWPEAARRMALAIQLTAADQISLEVEKAGNAYIAANPTVECHVSKIDDDGVTVIIPEMGVTFFVTPWYHCDTAAKRLFQTPAPAVPEATNEKTQISSQCMMKDLKTSSLAEGSAVKYCGHGDKMCEVYVKQEMDEDKVASLMTTLNLAMCSRDTREFREPIIGSIVAVKWSQDEGNMFYRASVTAINIEKKKAKLLLVDYGKRIMEDWANITWLPHQVRKSPMYAVSVILADVPSSAILQNSQLIDKITEDYINKSLKLMFVKNSTPPAVKLFINKNKTLNAELHGDGQGDQGLNEKEKKKLEIAKQLAMLQEELDNL